ncbi:hypothetical protein A3K78_00555 [Candidatus Bathyarchaeota archaeon RBG_13_52_12]|nr:MAG: hypothetical protein A3K78_00555 [Candidatus Bathyarchaeota archaeon RBG_13_52_12]
MAGQPQSVVPADSVEKSVAPAVSVERPVQTAEKVEAVSTVPMGEVVNAERLLPTLPIAQPAQLTPQLSFQPQPQPARSTVAQPPRPRQTSGQPEERPNIVIIGGEPAVQLKGLERKADQSLQDPGGLSQSHTREV